MYLNPNEAHGTSQPMQTMVDPVSRDHQIANARRAVLIEQAANSDWQLAPAIVRSWRRCMERGLDPHTPVLFDPLTRSTMRDAQEQNQPLLAAATPVIRALSGVMQQTRYFALLTDATGMVVDVQGPIDKADRHAAAIARVGLDLSESVAGTTAIGATLAELESVWLHRGEHFFDDTTVYSCAGAPIFGPTGDGVGMLDLTGVNVREQPALKHLVTRSARHIENALVLAQTHSFALRINWPGAQMGSESDGLLTLDDQGHITGCNRHAADLLNLPAGSSSKCANDVFATEWSTFADAARKPTLAMEVPLWSGLHMQVLVQRQSATPLRWAAAAPAQGRCLKEVETDLIRSAVNDARGNVADAARSLGISRATIYRKLGRHHTP